MTHDEQLRPVTEEEMGGAVFWQLLWDAAGVDADALQWIRDVELPRYEVLGAFAGSDLIGFAAYRCGTDRIVLEYIAVDEQRRGTGIGARLVAAARRARPELPLYAETDDDAVDFYRLQGFDVSPLPPPDTDAPGEPHWPHRARYACRVAPVDAPGARRDPVEATLAVYRTNALRFTHQTRRGPTAPLREALLALVPRGARVLELGSGPGIDADALEAAGLVVERTDGAPPFVLLLHSAGHAARVLDMRADDFGGPYDAVFANAVLLHLPHAQLAPVLETARRATIPGGVIAASFKKGDGEGWSDHKLGVPRYFAYWREDALAAAFAQAGWTEVSARETTLPGSPERWIDVTARNPIAQEAP